MKTNHFIVIVFSIAILGCAKPQDDYDYRTLYKGEFAFTTILYGLENCYDSSPTCIDGWTVYGCDTTFFKSNIESLDSNRLIIQFGNSIIGKDDKGDTITQTFETILLDGGKLLFPEFPKGGHNQFNGHYQGYDTILMDFKFGYGIGAYTRYKVTGIRVK